MTDTGTREDARRQLRRGNATLQAQVDTLLDGLRTQTEALAAAQGAVAGTTAQAESADGLVRVTVDAAGAVTSVEVDASAFGRTTPARLAEAFTAAARTATAEVRARVAEILAPVTALSADLPDLPDFVPGAPSLRNLVPTEATEFTPPDRQDPDTDDLHDWRAPILREAHRG
ncbi:YbaB/EbfC family nucleoid-associated protein [Rhodococcus sp. SGAir0479]|uniref:YbaB/EbfC family nucleoid-associated protein n=1 Tax=Rhodococcus sp. SGAir0479 TaxID=2567884 RepID=UPI0010CD12C4|nr:YbaB/EbfC family nucleoid-associated protein [Rhodococcus sp. SGAir0479]QCQ92358.1 YbaB/EbfC family DNA-binding protein [Rhodococcus sp. SGAir0479]